MANKFVLSLQQDLLTLLVHNEEFGKVIHKTISVDLFEGDYRTIAERAVDFWKKYGAPPKQHIADLLADVLENKDDRRAPTFRRILVQMYEVKDTINTTYVMRTAESFVRMQHAKSVLVDAAESIDAKGHEGVAEMEDKLRQFLRDRHSTLDPGLTLDNFDKVLESLARTQSEFVTGIRELDEANIVPMRGKLWMLVAPAKRGKTWGMIQLGKMAYMKRQKVLHVSLEIEAEEVAQRYYQAIFGASKRVEKESETSTFALNPVGDFKDLEPKQFVPAAFTFDSEAVRDELDTRIRHFGVQRAHDILIKRFPMRSLTVDQLEAYLDHLEVVEHFNPDMVILDYPGIMKTDAKNHRISLGRVVEELRGLAQRKNFALCAVHQTGRDAADSDMVRATDVAEDWSVVCTADFVLTYSQTESERKLGIARLFVDSVRSEQDKFAIWISQNYKTGQFVIESIRLPDDYLDIVESKLTKEGEVKEPDGNNTTKAPATLPRPQKG